MGIGILLAASVAFVFSGQKIQCPSALRYSLFRIRLETDPHVRDIEARLAVTETCAKKERGVQMGSVRTIALIAGICFWGTSVFASDTWVTKREAVAEGESYLLSSVKHWQTRCIRSADGEDACFAATDVNGAIPVELSLGSFPIEKRKVKADVDVVPVGILDIRSTTAAKLDEALYAGIDSLDGAPFDGYLCKLVDTADCLRGPSLDKRNWIRLLAANTAQISFFKKIERKKGENSTQAAEDFTLEKLDSVKVSLTGLNGTIAASEKQMAAMQNLSVYSHPREVASCVASIKGKEQKIRYVPDEAYAIEKTSVREALFGPKGSGDCPSYVTLAYLTPGITASQRNLFCLAYDKKENTYQGVGQGARNAYNLCKAPTSAFCERVNAGKNQAIALAAAATGTAVASASTSAITSSLGVTVVAHSSGAAILTGSAGYVAGTLGTAGVTALGVVTAPVTAAAAAVSAVSLGTAIFVCR